MSTNRVLAAIAKVSPRVDALAPDKRASLDESTRWTLDEFCNLQELKSAAHANGMLTLDEAQCIYMLLGETPDQANRADLAARIVLTQMHSELLSARISQQRAG